MNLADWTPERVETLRALHAEGKSAGDIAATLGGCSRNAVIGKKHRLGLVSNRPPEIRTSPVKRIRKPRPAPVWQAQPPPMLCEPVEEDAPADLSELITIYELTESTCRYPVGTREYRFCGKKTLNSLPYCAAHCRLCFHPRG